MSGKNMPGQLTYWIGFSNKLDDSQESVCVFSQADCVQTGKLDGSVPMLHSSEYRDWTASHNASTTQVGPCVANRKQWWASKQMMKKVLSDVFVGVGANSSGRCVIKDLTMQTPHTAMASLELNVSQSPGAPHLHYLGQYVFDGS